MVLFCQKQAMDFLRNLRCGSGHKIIDIMLRDVQKGAALDPWKIMVLPPLYAAFDIRSFNVSGQTVLYRCTDRICEKLFDLGLTGEQIMVQCLQIIGHHVKEFPVRFLNAPVIGNFQHSLADGFVIPFVRQQMDQIPGIKVLLFSRKGGIFDMFTDETMDPGIKKLHFVFVQPIRIPDALAQMDPLFVISGTAWFAADGVRCQ